MKKEDIGKIALDYLKVIPITKPIAEYLENIKTTMKDTKDLSYKIFLSKFYKIIEGTYSTTTDKVKLAKEYHEKFDNNISRQLQFISWIEGIHDLRKIQYYSNLFSCYLVCEIDEGLLFKLINTLERCTSFELDYIKNFDYQKESLLDTQISYLTNDGLFELCDNTDREVRYRLSSLATTLKQNSLNYEDGLKNIRRINEIEKLPPYSLIKPITADELDKKLEEPKIIQCSLDDV